MTAVATIGALLPLSFGVGEGALVSTGLAVVVIGGLITSTLLTLWVVPVMYELLHRRQVKNRALSKMSFDSGLQIRFLLRGTGFASSFRSKMYLHSGDIKYT